MSSRNVKLELLVETGRARALSSGRRVLVSLTEKIDLVDPLHVLESFARARSSDESVSASITADQMYWERPADSFAMAGIGAAATFEKSGPRRFADTDAEWKSLRDEAIHESDSPADSGAGPVLMGGFAFEPDGPRTALWRGFESSHLIIPALLVTSASGQSWITLSIIVSEKGETSCDPAGLVALANSLLQSRMPEDLNFRSGAEIDVNQSNMSSRSEWQHLVASSVAEIRAGYLEKVVVARGVRVVKGVPPAATPAPVAAPAAEPVKKE